MVYHKSEDQRIRICESAERAGWGVGAWRRRGQNEVIGQDFAACGLLACRLSPVALTSRCCAKRRKGSSATVFPSSRHRRRQQPPSPPPPPPPPSVTVIRPIFYLFRPIGSIRMVLYEHTLLPVSSLHAESYHCMLFALPMSYTAAWH